MLVDSLVSVYFFILALLHEFRILNGVRNFILEGHNPLSRQVEQDRQDALPVWQHYQMEAYSPLQFLNRKDGKTCSFKAFLRMHHLKHLLLYIGLLC